MQRPGPLQELPLERFLPTYPNKSVRSHKRPLSPGSPNPYSPTKRRILNSEGIFAPEKTCKTPMSLAKASPARFSNVLASSASPARILDFGLPKNHGGESTKRSSMHLPTQTQILSSRKKLASSLESKYKTFQHVSSTDTEVSSGYPTRPAALPIVVPRELPPPPDSQSIHYPGFVIFRDPYTTIYPADFNPERVSDGETNTDPSKENIPPHRKTMRKATLETLKFEVTLETGTPKRVHGPSSSIHHDPGLRPDLFSPCSPMKVDVRKDLRRMMEEEDALENEHE